MSTTTLSKVKLMAIGCLSIAAITGAVNVPSASAGDHYDRGHDDVRVYDYGRAPVYEHRGIYRRDDGIYQVRNHRRYCLELKESIYSLERTREQLLSRHHYNPKRLRWIERELRQKRFEYRRACR